MSKIQALRPGRSRGSTWRVRAVALVVLLCGAMLALPAASQKGSSVYDIQLKARRISPSPMTPEDIAKVIEQAIDERRRASDQDLKNAYVYFQFTEAADGKLTEQLESNGALLSSKLNDRSFIVRTSVATALRFAGDSGLRWAGEIMAADKQSAAIAKMGQFPWTERPGGRRAYLVVFHKGVGAQEVTALTRKQGILLEDFDPRSFSVVRVATLVMPPSQLDEFAKANSVAWIQPHPGPDQDNNLASAQPLSNVDDVQVAPYNLTGTGVTVGSWEAGDVIRATHVDLTPRVTVAAGQTASQDDHAAHTAGTIGGSGVNFPNAEGMATQVSIQSYDSTSDANEMTIASAAAAAPRVQISNHSYSKGSNKGWNTNGNAFNNDQSSFGSYDANSLAFDNVVVANDLIVSKAAGNDRQNDWDGVTAVDIDGDGNPDPTPPNDCRQSGFPVDADCISAVGSAKNVITVGALSNATRLWSGSAMGPTDDGRLKPDLMAQGNNMFSLGAANNNDTSSKSGTSMATPVITGIAALVLEEAASLDLSPTAAGVKALLIQSAQDIVAATDPLAVPLHAAVGPDYATGWGIVDAQAAIDLLRRTEGPGLLEDDIDAAGAAGARSYAFNVPAALPELQITLVWTDPSGDPTLAGNVPQLVNDLNLTLTEPDGVTTHTPWSLDPANPGTAAVRNGGADSINNVEQVSVLTPVEGQWTITVSAAAALTSAPQAFALAGPLTSQRSILLVMDRSGSMDWETSSGSGMTKLEALQNAAHQFIDIVELAGGHELGLVQYEEVLVPFAPAFDLQRLHAGSVTEAHAAIDSMDSGGWTNIIAGVDEGVTQVTTSGIPEQIVVLFSDGRHNRPVGSDLNDINGLLVATSHFYSVGFGDDTDDAILSTVAANHDGAHFNETDLPLGLNKLFATVAGLSTGGVIAIDPDYDLVKGARASLDFIATELDSEVTFSINWETPNRNQLSAQLEVPGGKCQIPLEDHPGLQTRSGNTYRLIQVKLPYRCPGRGLQHAGLWRLSWQANETDASDGREAIKVMALVKSKLELASNLVAADGEVFLTAQLTAPRMPNLPGRRVMAILQRMPAPSGLSEEQDKLGADFRPDKGSHDAPDAPLRVKLSDDGTGGDARKGDGVFSQRVKISKRGFYQVRIVSEAETKKGLVRRESLLSFHTGAEAAPGFPFFKIFGRTVNVLIVVGASFAMALIAWLVFQQLPKR